ncbi:MAG: Npt1/Npt2 family nucleotide transporter [Pseudomonadota bacterium]
MTSDSSRSIQLFLWFGVLLFSLFLLMPILRNVKIAVITSLDTSWIPQLQNYTQFFKIPLCILFIALYRPQHLPKLLGGTLAISLLIILGYFFLINSASTSPETTATPIWLYSSFYVFADLWSPWFGALLFWVFANQTITTDQAKWMYPGWGIFAAIAIFFGQLISLRLGLDIWDNPLGLMLTISATFSAIIFALVFLSLNRIQYLSAQFPAPQASASQFSLNFRIKYLLFIFGIIICYGLCTKIIDLSMKVQLKATYPDPTAYTAFMGQYMQFMSSSNILLFCLTCWWVWVMGWFRSALMVPVIALILGTALFVVHLLGYAPDVLLWYAIAAKVIMFGISWTVFLATKEIAYIPLNSLTKARGKAVIDFLLSREMLTSWIVIGLLVWDVKLLDAPSPYLAFVYLGTVLVWFFCLFKLKHYYNEALSATQS